MTRLDREAAQAINNPAIFYGWPEPLVRKIARASKQRTPKNIRLTASETKVLETHLDNHRGWFMHQGAQIVLRDGAIYRPC